MMSAPPPCRRRLPNSPSLYESRGGSDSRGGSEGDSAWHEHSSQALGYSIEFPEDARLLHPTWSTIAESPSEVLIVFNFRRECTNTVASRTPGADCPADLIDIAHAGGPNEDLADVVERDRKGLGPACTTNPVSVGAVPAIKLTGCLAGDSAFYYLQTTSANIKIGASAPHDLATQEILSTFRAHP
jgi:hypothetical protein